MTLRVLDLFSGIGGFSLGLERTGGFRTVAFCEIDPYCRAVLKKHWPDVPIHDDIRTLTAEQVGPLDLICGGYPCQPFSTAGNRAGAEDDRHLWPEYRRLIEALRPAWVIGENVAGHVTLGLDGVLSDLDALGYSCRPFAIPACAIDAKHRRERIWIVGYADRTGNRFNRFSDDGNWTKKSEERGRVERDKPSAAGKNVADTASLGCLEMEQSISGRERIEGPSGKAEYGSQPAGGGWWAPEPDVGRVANGVPSRVDRLRALGNAVVPQIPEIIGRAILEAERLNVTNTSRDKEKQ